MKRNEQMIHVCTVETWAVIILANAVLPVCTCSDTVQGMRSPEAFFPLDRLFKMDCREISPSRHTWGTEDEHMHMSQIKNLICDKKKPIRNRTEAHVSLWFNKEKAYLNVSKRNTPKQGVPSVLPGPQQGPQVVNSVWGEQVATGRRGDELEHQTTSAGHWGNSGAREKREISELANTHKDDKTVGFVIKFRFLKSLIIIINR